MQPHLFSLRTDVKIKKITHVIKLGGSLEKSNQLTKCLETIHKMPSNIVIVAGGGVFADQVRLTQKKWCFNEIIAHEMAILAFNLPGVTIKESDHLDGYIVSVSGSIN